MKSPKQALAENEHYTPLLLNPGTIAYFDSYINHSQPAEFRARMLHQVLLSPAFLGIEYFATDTLTAEHVLQQKSANCLGFANAYIALARHYGLKAHFQIVEKYPQWDRNGAMVSMNIHVNSVIDLSTNKRLVVEINSSRLQGTIQATTIGDKQAAGLFYNNLAMSALANGEHYKAYRLLTKAIALFPQKASFWSNLGATYKANQQLIEAEKSYLTAIAIDPFAYAAINNLATLYDQQGQTDNAEIFLTRLGKLRQKNPYYFYSLAKEAELSSDYLLAKKLVLKAINLKADEPLFEDFLARILLQEDLLAIN
ncbi:tetratricopeptide repeat protein [Oceanicoccus sp. KOV_DT_Chl]|uniref:tetratricopeptide repeat protein n=1 Tax=Oceanicoccus sp. KOV_DT_Chl TaxID=1904639 RepID=UPI000C7CC193|nr:tetratricopeptide repeat protein [Oceanicoccus sp. KOV_DT_Chl]